MLNQEERLINLYEALGYCDAYEAEKENIYDIIQYESVKLLCEQKENDELVVHLRVDMDNFIKDLALLIVSNPKYMIIPSSDYILINNVIYILNNKKRLYTVKIVKMEE